MSVYLKLNEAREKFHSMELKKTGKNNFAGYSYFELGDFLIPALKVFKEVGLCAVVSFDKELATMTIVDTVSNGQIIITSPLSEANLKGCHPVQNVGACETYARRYLWVAALEIVEHDALDATTGKKGDGPVITPKSGIGDDLPEDAKNYLLDIATQCIDLVKEGQPRKAYELIKANKLDDDQEIWLSRQMDSKTRAAIKASKDIPL